MSQPFLGQLMLASFNFAPKNWVQCNGQLIAINTSAALFALLGTTYGGNGIQNFALPNLQGRTPVGVSSGIVQGAIGGEEAHTLFQGEVPTHFHQLNGSGAAASGPNPSGGIFATTSGNETVYASAANLVALNGQTIQSIGGSQPHENRQPYLVMNWCIALSGIFPSRN